MTERKTEGIDSENVLIRKYYFKDKQALRKLCCDTAYFGDSCDVFFPDRELLADLIMKYHTDYEPEHIWVAEHKKCIVGYISACFDETKYKRIMLFRIVPVSLIVALIRGKMWSMKTFKMIAYFFSASFLKETKLVKLDQRNFPVHIHQNIKNGFRSRGIGGKLLEAFINEATRNRIQGIKFKTLRQKPCFSFFEKCGFIQYDCKRVLSWESWLGKKPLYFMEYGKSFND